MLQILLLGLVASLVSSAAVHDLSISGALLQGNFKIGDAQSGLFSAQSIDSIVQQHLATVKNEENVEKLFAEFKQLFKKTYESADHESTSKSLFLERTLMVLENNVKALHGHSSYVQQIQSGSDLPLEQILLQPAGNWPQKSAGQFFEHTNVVNASTSEYVASWVLDYTGQKQVASVVNQGSCGACVYFAAAALVESYWARKGHGLDHLSTQQLNDCAHDEAHGNHGCQNGGGTFVPTFNYIKAHGLTSWNNYPYETKDDNCKRDKEAQAVAHITNWHPIEPHGDELAMEAVMHDHGPVAVAIHVSDSLAHYKSGIFDGDCKGGRNHAVLAVGYGWDDASKRDYWVLKNQWGDGWGEHGFFKLQRKHGNMCDVAADAVWVE